MKIVCVSKVQDVIMQQNFVVLTRSDGDAVGFVDSDLLGIDVVG